MSKLLELSASGPVVMSPCRMYRYTLERAWDADRPRVAFVGLNPSTADETKLDPTLRRCVTFADAWGYGSFTMLNLFAFRTVSPAILKRASVDFDVVGPNNDAHILAAMARCRIWIACWGTHGGFRGRDKEVRDLLRGHPSYHMGLTKDGHPCHPLYLSSSTEPEPWR